MLAAALVVKALSATAMSICDLATAQHASSAHAAPGRSLRFQSNIGEQTLARSLRV